MMSRREEKYSCTMIIIKLNFVALKIMRSSVLDTESQN